MTSSCSREQRWEQLRQRQEGRLKAASPFALWCVWVDNVLPAKFEFELHTEKLPRARALSVVMCSLFSVLLPKTFWEWRSGKADRWTHWIRRTLHVSTSVSVILPKLFIDFWFQITDNIGKTLQCVWSTVYCVLKIISICPASNITKKNWYRNLLPVFLIEV